VRIRRSRRLWAVNDISAVPRGVLLASPRTFDTREISHHGRAGPRGGSIPVRYQSNRVQPGKTGHAIAEAAFAERGTHVTLISAR